MFSSPFPEFIQFCYLEASDLSSHVLLPEEEAYIQSIKVNQRRVEFLLGRACAHQALIAFQLSNSPILKDKNSAPIWPETVIGSIAHAKNKAVACAGKQTMVQGIGIDIEDLERSINLSIQRHVCVSEEKEWLAQLPSSELSKYLKIIFSAKESIFKCFFPLSNVYLHFHDAQITFTKDSSCFEFKLFKTCGPEFREGFQHQGTYQIVEDMVMTSVWVPV
ncbi:MAG: 4'-phosphopantetheinyl transferase superfamily protein [SAR324 cluster bacterium]|nr:4'-phosphopantetheinyl transferase superfamily protein [SAR324 cluster bacterium]